MQNYCKTIGALAAASALVAGNAQAEVEYELHTGYSSEYLFRGVDLGQDLVEVGVDAAYQWNGLSLSGGVWATAFNSAAFSTGKEQIYSETDLYAEVSKDLGFLTASVGYIYYFNAGHLGVDNQEVYFGLSRDLGFATISLTYYWDIINNSGVISQGSSNEGYTELGLSRKFELNQCLTLNVGANVGYLVEADVFTALTSKVSLDWGFADHAKLSPFVAFSLGLGEEAGSIWKSTENELTAGSMLSVSF